MAIHRRAQHLEKMYLREVMLTVCCASVMSCDVKPCYPVIPPPLPDILDRSYGIKSFHEEHVEKCLRASFLPPAVKFRT